MGAAVVRLSAVFLACSAAGCGLLLDYDPPDQRDTGASLDAGRRDAGPRDAAVLPDSAIDAPDLPDAPPIDGGTLSPCFGLAQGADCSGAMTGAARRICIDGACVPSSCGDGFVDTDGGEQCEPAADTMCGPLTCRYECETDSDCPIVSACLATSCSAHRCTYLADHGGSVCMTPDGVTGMCALGMCFPPGCGNGTVEPALGEECDPGTTSFTGCHSCRFDCHTDGDCSDRDGCDGIESCVAVRDASARLVGQHCQMGTPVSCPAPMPCFSGGCATLATGMGMCTMTLIDLDGDGFAHGDACGGGLGGDCNDADPNVHPGAPEICNTVDDDCNGSVDDGTTSVTWCLDGDGDGYGDPATSTTSCGRPSGPFVRDCTDCWDTIDPLRRSEAAVVHPMQAAFFTTPYCPGGVATCSFDYDCDHNDVEQTTAVVNCGLLAPLLCASSAGWAGTVPPCGVAGTFDTCHSPVLGLLCRTSMSIQTQACH